MKRARQLLGILTLVCGALGGFYLWSLLDPGSSSGDFRFTLLFASADGLAPGAAIKYRGVRVGEVQRISLGPDDDLAQVACAVDARARSTLGITSQFWIVRPRFEGIAEGASGLDTLIKDSYITYLTPPGEHESLPVQARVRGLDDPPHKRLGVDAPQSGDLNLTVLFAESGGLQAQSPVRHRGLPVGVVTSVALDPSSESVVVTARIRRKHRSAITDATQFWVAKPSFSARWLKGVAVHDLEALLNGAYLTFRTPPRRLATPARDGSTFVGSPARPDFEWDEPRVAEASSLSKSGADDPIAPSLVTVHYSCRELDWFSADDHYFVTSLGILFESREGKPAVLVARSGVQGAAFIQDGTGKPEIRNELWRVTLRDGSVFGAEPAWISEPSADDLALLFLKGETLPPPPPAPLSFEPKGGPVEIRFWAGEPLTQTRVVLRNDGSLSGVGPRVKRGIVIKDGGAIGIVTSNPGTPLRMTPFSRLPKTLRE